MIEAAPTTEPVERSNSPAIIRSPIGNGDDAELGGGVEPARRAGEREEAVGAADEGEEDVDHEGGDGRPDPD